MLTDILQDDYAYYPIVRRKPDDRSRFIGERFGDRATAKLALDIFNTARTTLSIETALFIADATPDNPRKAAKLLLAVQELVSVRHTSNLLDTMMTYIVRQN